MVLRLMPNKTKTIRQEELIPAEPIEVYEALLDAEKHSEFTGSKATSNSKVGSKFTAWDGYISGKNLKLEKGKRIVQEWKTTEWPAGCEPSIVEFTFKKAKKGTELTMVHSNVPAEQADSYRQGWIDSYWEPLKEYFKKKKSLGEMLHD
jgi:activator of HSP90 ATPase